MAEGPLVNIGLVLPSNYRGGPQQLAIMAASDLSQKGHKVRLFVPLFPWWYYFVTLGRNPARWLKYALRDMRILLQRRKFVFHDLLETQYIGQKFDITFVPMAASKKQLKDLDCLLLNSIGQVVEYRQRYPQERQIYLVHHPEEDIHGHHEQIRAVRSSFKGKIVAVSPFTSRALKGNPPVVPNPISSSLWENQRDIELEAPRKDILLYWKTNSSGRQAMEIVEALRQIRPRTTLTIWCSGVGAKEGAEKLVPKEELVEDLSNEEVLSAYYSHSFLLFPSTYEGSGMPPVEGLACGCIPVLRPEVGAAELYAADGQNSVYIEGTPQAVAERLNCLLSKGEALKYMRASARESISQFNPNGYGLRLLQAAGFL